MARMGAGVGCPGHFATVMLGGRVGTFRLEAQPEWPLAEPLGTWAPLCPLPGQNWESQQGASGLPKGGLLGQ